LNLRLLRALLSVSVVIVAAPLFAETYSWMPSAWSACSVVCGTGTQQRSVVCVADSTGTVVADSLCTSVKPATVQACVQPACSSATWAVSDWAGCSVACGGGTQFRNVTCVDQNHNILPDSACAAFPRPASTQACNVAACPSYEWAPGAWSVCSAACGAGVQTRAIACLESTTHAVVPSSFCSGQPIPAQTQACNNGPCSAPLSSLTVAGAQTYPAFDPTIMNYTVLPVVADGVTALTVSASTVNTAAISITANGATLGNGTGSVTATVPLTGCPSVIHVTTSLFGENSDTAINATRAACLQGQTGAAGPAGPAGPAGATGPQGIQGPQGIPGLAAIERIASSPVTVAKQTSGTATATCPAGKVAIAGGFAVGLPPGSTASPSAMSVTSSANSGASAWSVTGFNGGNGNAAATTLTLTANVTCAIVQ
jgi:hypothetical protein